MTVFGTTPNVDVVAGDVILKVSRKSSARTACTSDANSEVTFYSPADVEVVPKAIIVIILISPKHGSFEIEFLVPLNCLIGYNCYETFMGNREILC